MMDDKDFLKFKEKLEADGVEKVRYNLANNIYGEHKIPIAKQWLKDKENQDNQLFQIQTLDIAKEANSIAKNANQLAEHANQHAGKANKLALVAIYISVLLSVLTIFISWLIQR